MFREGFVEARVDQKVTKLWMVYPVHQYREIARSMVAVGLLRACRIEVQARVHMDNAGLQRRERNVTRMRKHIVPVGEGSGRNWIGRDLESTKSSTHQVGSKSGNSHNQNGRHQEKSFEYPHGSRKSLLSNVLRLTWSRQRSARRS